MAEILNIRRFSKQKMREKRAVEASENAAKHGRTKEEKSRDRAAAKALKKHLDSHKRHDP